MESTTMAPDQSSTKPHDMKEVATILKTNNEISFPTTEVGEKGEVFSSETAITKPSENKSDKRNETMATKEENYKGELKENYSEISPGTLIVGAKEETEMSKKMESASNGTASGSNGKVHDNKHGTTVDENKDKEEHDTIYGCEVSVGIIRKVEESVNPSIDVEKERENPKDKESASSEAATSGSDDKLNQMIQTIEKREKGIDGGSSDSKVPVVVTKVEPQNVKILAHAENEVLKPPNKIESPFNETVAVEADEKLYGNGKRTHVEEPTKRPEEKKDSCADQSVDINKTEQVNSMVDKETARATTGSDDKISQTIKSCVEAEKKIEGRSSGTEVPVDVAKVETENVNSSSAHTDKKVLEPQHETESPINEIVKVETDEKEKGAHVEETTEKVEENKDSCTDESADSKKTEKENPEDKESTSTEPATTESDNKISQMIQNCEETEKKIEGKSSGSEVPVDETKAEPKNVNSSAYTEKEVLETQHEVELPIHENVKVESDEKLYEKDKRAHIEEPIKKVEDNKDSCADQLVGIKKDEQENPKDKESENSGPATTRSDDKISQMIKNCVEKEKQIEIDGSSSDSNVSVGVKKDEPQNVSSSAHTEREVLETQNKIDSSINETVNVESGKELHDKGKEADVEKPTKKVEDKVSCADDIKKAEEEDITSPPRSNEEKKPAIFLTESEDRKDEKTPIEEKKIDEKRDKKSGPEVSLPKAQEDATTPRTGIDHKEVQAPKNKESPTSEYFVEGPHGMAQINKDEKITPIEEKAEKDDCRNLSCGNSTENSLKEETVVVASNLRTSFEVVEEKTDKKPIDTLEVSDDKVEKPRSISEAISSLEAVQKVRKEPEDSANTGEDPHENGRCETTEDVSMKGAEVVVKKDALPDGTPKVSEALISESSKAVVSEAVDLAKQKESLSDDVSKVEEPPKPLCEVSDSVKEVNEEIRGIIPKEIPEREEAQKDELHNTLPNAVCAATKAMEPTGEEKKVGESAKPEDESPLVDPPQVENVPAFACSAQVIKNESVEGTKNEDVKEEVQKFPEISKEMANESNKAQLQLKQEVRENMETEGMKESATKETTEKALESFNDEDGSNADIETTKEGDHVKHAHHSSNIISKVKHSIVNVKKKILGKSTCLKNVSPEVRT